MGHYDELFKHLGEYSPDQLAALTLNTEQVSVRDSLNTEQPTVKFHHGQLEVLMRESPVYETVIQRGIQQGIEQGKKEYAVEAILTVLEVKFQTDVAEKLKPFVSAIDDLQRLDHLLQIAAQVSVIDAFTQALLNLEN